MIRSLAAHIPCSKSVIVALMFSVAGGGASAQESPLSEQDRAFIEQGKQIAQKAQRMEMPSLLQNQHMDEAQAEAKASTPTIGYWFSRLCRLANRGWMMS